MKHSLSPGLLRAVKKKFCLGRFACIYTPVLYLLPTEVLYVLLTFLPNPKVTESMKVLLVFNFKAFEALPCRCKSGSSTVIMIRLLWWIINGIQRHDKTVRSFFISKYLHYSDLSLAAFCKKPVNISEYLPFCLVHSPIPHM